MKNLIKILAVVLIVLLTTMCGQSSKLSPDEAKKLISEWMYNGKSHQELVIWIFDEKDRGQVDRSKGAEVFQFMINQGMLSPSPAIRETTRFGSPIDIYSITDKGMGFIKGIASYPMEDKVYGDDHVGVSINSNGERYIECFVCYTTVDFIIHEILHRNDTAEVVYTTTLSQYNPIVTQFPTLVAIQQVNEDGKQKRSDAFIKYREGWRKK